MVANDKEILAKYDELDRCKKVEMALHRDLAEGVILASEYEQFKSSFSRQYMEIEETIRKLQEEIELMRFMLYNSNRIEIVFKFQDET